MSAKLYTRNDGKDISIHSYSSGATFDECARKYSLEKIHGWKRKGNKGALKFGICVEEGLMFFHNNGRKPGSGVDEFKRRWLAYKEDSAMEFTAKEGDWSDLYKMGSEMLQLYEILLPTLPINEPVFQINYKREVFPGTKYAGIEHTAFLDMVSKAPWSHPMLSRVTKPEGGAAHRPLLIDIKTSSTALGAVADMLSLDPQLREYAWTAGIPDIAFLFLVKGRPGLDKGTEVHLLADHAPFKAGDKAAVVYVQKPDAPEPEPVAEDPAKKKRVSKAPPPEPRARVTEERVGLIPANLMYDFDKSQEGVRGKALEALKKEYVATWGALVAPEITTKVQVQFAATRIGAEDMAEVSQNVGRQIVEIVRASELNQWPKNPSVRFPNQRCIMCQMRGHCLNKPDLVEKMLVQVGPATPAEPDWLDELESGE